MKSFRIQCRMRRNDNLTAKNVDVNFDILNEYALRLACFFPNEQHLGMLETDFSPYNYISRRSIVNYL